MALCSRCAALFAERLGGWVFAIVVDGFFNLASQYAHDMDGVADYVGGTLLAFRSFWHWGARAEAEICR
jgi:hypothetical protein